MRKKDEKRCKKGQETTIGKIIYGFLLFMPLLAIGTTCLISTFNMSAKEETEITYKYETNEINSVDDLIVGNLYNFSTSSNLEGFYELEGSIVNLIQLDIPDNNDLSVNDFYDNGNSTNLLLNFKLEGEGQFATLYVYTPFNNLVCEFYIEFDSDIQQPTYSINFDFIFIQGNSLDYRIINFINSSSYNEIESVETHNLDTQEVFYNAVDKITESPLFNWAENSIIYTTTNATCNALSITAPFIPLLLSYWLIISVIYFLYDIALMLVWMIHRKIHELQESL